MILANSAARSKSEFSGLVRKKKARLILAGAAATILLILVAGPDIFLNVLLTRILPSEYGVTISYDRARAGFLFRSVTIDNILVNSRDESRPPLSAEYLGVKRLSVLNLTRLLRNPRKAGGLPLPLAGEVHIRGFSGGAAERLKAELVEVRKPAYQPTGSDLGPWVFDKLEVRGLSYESQRFQDEPRLSLSRLEARALSPDFLGGLRLNGLKLEYGPVGNDRLALDLSGLTVGGLRTAGLWRAAAGRDGLLSLLWALTACDTLDLARTVLTRGEREALNISGVVFDFAGSGGNGPAVYTRRLSFTVDLEALGGWPENDPYRLIFKESFGGRFEMDAEMELDYHRGEGLAELRSLRLQSPGLGVLTSSARLSALAAQRGGPAMTPSDLLFYIAGGRLEALSLDFADQGLMSKLYRYLDKTAFRYAPGRRSADKIMDRLIIVARSLEDERGLANIPALLSEAEAFLDRPERLKVTAAPPHPQTIMSLANLDKYDIIEKLHLTVQVNNRAPVVVAVASGVFHERLPSAPRPMENLFEEEDI